MLAAAILAASLTACGNENNNTEPATDAIVNTGNQTENNTISSSGATETDANPDNTEADILSVNIYSKTTADLSLYNVIINDSNVDIGTWEIGIAQYLITLSSFSAGNLQCSVWEKSNGNESFISNIDYTYENNTLTFHVDMSAISGFDFSEVDTYMVYIDTDGRSGSQIPVFASEAVVTTAETIEPPATEVGDGTSSKMSEETICVLRAYEEWVYAPIVLGQSYNVTTYYVVRFKDDSAPSNPSFDDSPYLDWEQEVVFPNSELADMAYGDYTGDNEVSICGCKVTIKFAYPPSDDVWYGIDFLEQSFRNRGFTVTEVYKG